MTTEDITITVAKELEEILNAPKVELGPPVGRCSWCGRLSNDLALVEVTHGMERFKCHVCRGVIYE